MQDLKIGVLLMSGLEDGKLFRCYADRGHGELETPVHWVLTMGRHDSCDVCLKADSYISRTHARLHWRAGDWWLEDLKSTNGTFIILEPEFFRDVPVTDEWTMLQPGQLFKLGKTWLRLYDLD